MHPGSETLDDRSDSDNAGYPGYAPAGTTGKRAPAAGYPGCTAPRCPGQTGQKVDCRKAL